MKSFQRGFTLIELIAVMILVGIVSVTLMTRMSGVNTAGVQAGRDSLIAACFFSQQTAMARAGSGNPVQLIVSNNTINVTENGNSLVGYPLTLSGNVSMSATPSTYSFDKLGRTAPGSVTISHPSGAAVTVTLEASGYAHY